MCQLFSGHIQGNVGLKDASSHSGPQDIHHAAGQQGRGRAIAWQRLAGHSHISTTQRYIDVNSEQLSEAVELL